MLFNYAVPTKKSRVTWENEWLSNGSWRWSFHYARLIWSTAHCLKRISYDTWLFESSVYSHFKVRLWSKWLMFFFFSILEAAVRIEPRALWTLFNRNIIGIVCVRGCWWEKAIVAYFNRLYWHFVAVLGTQKHISNLRCRCDIYRKMAFCF